MGEQAEGAIMAPSFPSPHGDSLGASPTKPSFQTPADCPSKWLPTSPTTQPALRLLEEFGSQLEGVFEWMNWALEDNPDYQSANTLHQIGMGAMIRHIMHVVAAPTLPPDPLIDVEDLQCVLDHLMCVMALQGQNWEEVHQAKAKLVELMKRGVRHEA